MTRLLLLHLCAALVWAQAPAAKSALDKKTLEAYLRHLLLYPPHVQIAVGDPKPSEVPGLVEVNVHASAGSTAEDRVFLVSRDGSRILDARVYDVRKNPFQKDLDKLNTGASPALGTAGAPVVIVIFSDFQCSYCAQEAKSLRTELVKAFPTQVRLYFKDMPLQQIHPWAMPAAIAGRCLFRQQEPLFWEFHDWAFGNQTQLTPENFAAKLTAWAKSKNLDTAQLDACRTGKEAEAEVLRSIAEARSLGVASTPTMYLNGRKLGGYLPWENLKQIIEFEIGYQATAKNAGECCALPPLSPARAQ